jgi:beta-barrel assembly-enhancing protease
VLSLALAMQALAPATRAQPAPESRNNLPALGDTASEDFSVANERRIGDRIMRDIRRDPDYLDDPVLLDYLQGMWTQLLRASRASGQIPAELDERFAWELFLVRDRTVNAFALPGGYSGVHLGLIAITPTPDELASVMAHELSHITQRHIARSIGASKTTSLVGIAGLILGILAASRSPEAANALIVGGQAVSVQGQLNYSREAEREADRVGFSVLTGA